MYVQVTIDIHNDSRGQNNLLDTTVGGTPYRLVMLQLTPVLVALTSPTLSTTLLRP